MNETLVLTRALSDEVVCMRSLALGSSVHMVTHPLTPDSPTRRTGHTITPLVVSPDKGACADSIVCQKTFLVAMCWSRSRRHYHFDASRVDRFVKTLSVFYSYNRDPSHLQRFYLCARSPGNQNRDLAGVTRPAAIWYDSKGGPRIDGGCFPASPRCTAGGDLNVDECPVGEVMAHREAPGLPTRIGEIQDCSVRW